MAPTLKRIGSGRNRDTAARLEALDRSQAVITFDLDGTILDANQNFLRTMGYRLDEVQGKHHRMFVDPAERSSDEYREFWDSLREGRYRRDLFKRFGKGGKEIWIEASYNPILDGDGQPYKVVKYATDVTDKQMRLAELEGLTAAISRVQAVISFDLDGTILGANQNFLDVVGYTIGEIRGRHHSMFVDPDHRHSPEYAQFWRTLASGEFLSARYRRIGKGGKEVWIEASYNPIFDANGHVHQVVKFATDISAQIRLLHDLKDLIDGNFGDIERSLARSTAQSASAAQSVDATSTNVQMVAAGAQQLAASVTEISQSMTRSKDSADLAYAHTATANDATERLTVAAAAMGGIVEVIQDIASQINLLALNATIESARAGEAGRGFAVVANEVKNLAKQAADATEQISQEIDAVRAVSAEVVDALGGIRQAMDTVRESVTTTASAVEEQSVVTQTMSATMHEASDSVHAINDNVRQISTTVDEVTDAVNRTKHAALVLTD
jgi:methyl-accepting chemotaxis protein